MLVPGATSSGLSAKSGLAEKFPTLGPREEKAATVFTSGLSPNVVTSLSGAVRGEPIFGPSPNSARRFPRLPPLTLAVWYTRWLLADAPTVTALGATPGVLRL